MKPVSFYLVTDTHYFEPSLGAEGKAYEEYMKTEQYFLRESSLIIRSVFEQIAKDDKTELVILPGDLSKNGEKESHKSFIRELNKLKAAGKKVFVLTASHDYNDKAYGYKNDERVPVEGTSFEELYDLYYDFGYAQAVSVDKQTLSYMAEVSPGVRMLAVNCDSPGSTKGVFDDRLLCWAETQIKKAKQDGCFVFAICHYPVIPARPIFEIIEDTKVRQWRKAASFLADNGVELVLTGHMHTQSINEYYSEKGNRLLDICTSCAVGSPAQYRKISVSQEAVLKIETVEVPDFGWDMNGLSVREYFDRQFEQAITNRIRRALGGGNGIKKLMKKAGTKLFDTVTVGGLARLLGISVDKSLRKRKLSDLLCEVGISLFAGDPPYVEGTPVYEALKKILTRLRFVLKKTEPGLKKAGVKGDLTELILNSVGNNKGFSDRDAEFKLRQEEKR